MHERRHPFLDGVDVEHVDVRPLADGEHAAVVQAQHAGGHGTHAAHRLLQGVDAGVPVPVRQDERAPAGVDHLADVGARVAEAGHRPLGRDELLEGFEVHVEAAHVEQGPAVGLVGDAQEGLHRMFAGGLGQVVQALVQVPRVVRARSVAEVEPAPRLFCARFPERLHLVDDAPARVRVADGGQPRVHVEIAHRLPRLDRYAGREEPVRRQAPDAAAAAGNGHRGDVETLGAHLHDALVQALVAHFDGRAEQGSAGHARFVGDEVQFRVELPQVGDGLHEAAVGAHGAGDRPQFVAVREGAGYRTPVRQHVLGQPVRREADGAFRDRLAGECGDLANLVLGGRFFHGPLAHDVEADRAVSDESGDVDRRAELFEGVQVAPVGLPVPRQAVKDRVLRNVLDRFHHAGEELPVGRLAGREGHSTVAEQRRGDAMPGNRRDLRVPADLGVEMRVQVDEAGGYRQPARGELFPAGLRHFPDFHDSVAVDRDVGLERRCAGPIDDVAPSNDQIMGHGVLPG